MPEFEKETPKVIRGESRLDAELLNKMHEEPRASQERVRSLEEDIENCERLKETLSEQFDEIQSWADMFDVCDLEAKKMILSRIFTSIKVQRDYRIEIEVELLGIFCMQNIPKYSRYKQAGRSCGDKGCLRAMADWERFWFKVNSAQSGQRIKADDMDRGILQSCVRGWRYHGWCIPFLDGNHSTDEKIKFANCFNVSARRSKISDWSNAMRKARHGDTLPKTVCQNLLDEMRSVNDRISRS